MEILFKDDLWLYYIEEGLILYKLINHHHEVLSEIKHLDDVRPIYHYRYEDVVYPVYYEHNGRFLSMTEGTAYYTVSLTSSFIKDYTLVNLNLL